MDHSLFKLTALGMASVGAEAKVGVLILEPNSNDILIGMDLLRTFAKALVLHPHKPFMVLEDCATVDAAIAQASPPSPSSAATATRKVLGKS